MREYLQYAGEVSDPALLRLLGLGRQIFQGETVWLLVREPDNPFPLLFHENGPVAHVVESDWQFPTGPRIDAAAMRACFPAVADVAEEKGLTLQAGVAVPAGGGRAGYLIFGTREGRACSPTDWRALEDLAEQAAVVLERNRLAGTLEESRAGERTASQGLAHLQHDFALVTDHVLEMICKIDLKGVVRFISPAGERLFGYGHGELAGRRIFDLIHRDDRKAAVEALREWRNNGHFELEVRCRCSDGCFLPFLCFGTALHDDPMVPSGFLVAGRNIVRRKKAEEALRRLQTRFQLVWENSRDAMRLINRDGIVLQVNDAYCRLIGKPREELVGKLFSVVYTYDDPEAAIASYREKISRRTMPGSIERELTLWDGSRRVFQLSNSLFDVEESTLLLTIYHDITERRNREGELNRLNEALRQRADHLGALTLQLTRVEQEERRRLAQILHDHLQQLLVAARMGMERVRARITDEPSATTLAEVESLLEESIKASRSITMELSPPVLHDGGLIPALEWLARRMLEKHRLEVRIFADPGVDCPSPDLRVFLFQAVRELLFNCYKHAGVDQVNVTVQPLGKQRIQIEVRDHGNGFSLEETAAGGKHSGDCFGLFSLRERTNHIGGMLTIKTSPGNGTAVTLVAPLEPRTAEGLGEEAMGVRRPVAAQETPSLDCEERGSGNQVRLVLVDDHKIMRQGLRELLREQEDMIVVGEAENGLEGLKLAQRLRPDVVIMDISMPVMNGIEATRVLAAKLPEIKVVGLSMHVKEDMATAILDAGAAAYVTKSTASETLTDTIRQVVGLAVGDAGIQPEEFVKRSGGPATEETRLDW